MSLGEVFGRDISNEVRGHKAREMLDYLADTMKKEQHRVISQVMNTIKLGETLPPEYAVQAWMQLSALRDVESRLQTDIKKGLASSKRTAVLRPDIGS